MQGGIHCGVDHVRDCHDEYFSITHVPNPNKDMQRASAVGRSLVGSLFL
jgi:hypothetical protein